MSEADKPPSNWIKDITDNDDRPPSVDDRSVRWDFIRSGLRQRSVESNVLDLGYHCHHRRVRVCNNRLVGVGSTKV